MAENDVNVRFGAQIDDLKSKVGEVQNIFKDLTQRFVVLAAAAAGGAAFSNFIDEANQMNIAAEKASRTIGITASEAGILAVAIDDIAAKMGTTANLDTYTSSFMKFNRMLKANSEDLKKMGVDVDGLKNGTKTSNQLFEEALQIVPKYAAGIDQTQVAMKMFGRSVQDVQVLMQLNKKALEDARKAAKDLNLTITAEGVKAAEDYRVAMDNVGDVLQGFKKTIGEAVMPMFTEFATQLASFGPTLIEVTQDAVNTFIEIWTALRETVTATIEVIVAAVNVAGAVIETVFGKDGPGAMQIFRNALGIVLAAFVAFRIGFQEIANALKTGLEVIAVGFRTFAAVAERALALDFAGAKAAWKAGIDERNRVLAQGIERAVQIAERGAADLDKALVSGPTGGPKASTPAGQSGTGGTKKAALEDPGAAAKAAALAAAQNALEKARTEASLALQQEYLRQAQSIYDDAYAKNLITTQQFYAAQLAIQLQGTDAELAAKREEAAAVAKLGAKTSDPVQKTKFQAQEVALAGQINVLEAKRVDQIRASGIAYAQAEQERADAMAKVASGSAQSTGNNSIAGEKAALDQLKALRQISAQDAFAIERDLAVRSYGVAMSAAQAKQELVRGDAVKQAEVNAEVEALQQAHQARMLEIDRQAALESARYSLQAQDSISSSFTKMIDGLISGYTTLQDAVREFGRNVADTFTNLIAQRFTEQLFDAAGVNQAIDALVNAATNMVDAIVRKFIGGEAAKTAATTAGTARRKAVETSGAVTTETIEAGKTAAVVASSTAQSTAAVASAAIRETADVTASETSIAATGASAIANIAAKAWEAAASVYAAIASIPYVGPFLAPVMAIAAGAAVLGFIGRIASSAGGDDQVGQDRLNLVHKDETILSRPFATGLRKLVGEGGITPVTAAVDQVQRTLASAANKSDSPSLPTTLPASTSAVGRINEAANPSSSQVSEAQSMLSSRGGEVKFTVNAIDATGVKKFLMSNGREIAKSMQNQGRNFVGLKPS